MNTIDDLFGFSDLCESEKYYVIGSQCGCVVQNTCMSGVTCGSTYSNPYDSCPPYNPRALYPSNNNCGVENGTSIAVNGPTATAGVGKN